MIGAIAGDIIGSRFERHNTHRTDFELFGAGCRFTDDTVLIAASERTGPYHSCGNGSAVRATPIAFAFHTLEEALDQARASAVVTHNHPEGIRGARAVPACIEARVFELLDDRLAGVVKRFRE